MFVLAGLFYASDISGDKIVVQYIELADGQTVNMDEFSQVWESNKQLINHSYRYLDASLI
jgi:hypothetical protein